ncbi:hypothetical protein Bca4012_039196 [Brassica carinata]
MENTSSWNALMAGYCKYGSEDEAFGLFWEIQFDGRSPDEYTLGSVLKMCTLLGLVMRGSRVGKVWNMTPHKPGMPTCDILIARNGFAYKAIECFSEMRREGNQLNQFTFPSVLTACAAVSARRIGVQVHGCVVKSGFKTSIFFQSAVIAIEGLKEEALSLFGRMHARDMKIYDFTIPSILNCFASSRTKMKIASSVHYLIVKTGYRTYKLVNNALVDMYGKRGIMDSAVKVFERMVEKEVISWTALVTGNTHNGSYEETLKVLCNMRAEGDISPDQFITASVLSASAELILLEFGQQVHGSYIKSGFPSSLSVDNSLDLIRWTALIVGYPKNGKAKDSLKSYKLMIGSGITPDYVTFIGLLFACIHAGLIEEAQRYFDSMRTVYGITPGPEHYACMIDLYGRSGDFTKAEELLNQMEVEPDATVWKAILAASRKHGNIENGKRAAKTHMEQEEAANVRRLMKSRNISKEPGCSWVEGKGKVHSFMSEDIRHPRMVEIYSKVDETMRLIKEAGYLPDMSFALHDLDKEGKELGLAYHSEKLAVAFGLLAVPSGAPIRIIKNLRVCGDCHNHNAMKYISRVYLRHIILRDSNCFHHFRDGNCSCGDYW